MGRETCQDSLTDTRIWCSNQKNYSYCIPTIPTNIREIYKHPGTHLQLTIFPGLNHAISCEITKFCNSVTISSSKNHHDFPHVFRHFPPLLTLKKAVPGGPVVPLRLLRRFCFYLLWRFRHRIALATGLEHITLIRFSWRDAGARNMIYIIFIYIYYIYDRLVCMNNA